MQFATLLLTSACAASVGAAVEVTTTLKLLLACWVSLVFVTTQVTGVVPNWNVVPEAGEQLTLPAAQPEATGAV